MNPSRSNKVFLVVALVILLSIGIVAYSIGFRFRANDTNQPSRPQTADEGNEAAQELPASDHQLRFEPTGASTGVIYDSMNNVVLELDDGQ